jgi:hypothetical protein
MGIQFISFDIKKKPHEPIHAGSSYPANILDLI